MNSTHESFEKYERKRSTKKAKAYDSDRKQSHKDVHKIARKLKRMEIE